VTEEFGRLAGWACVIIAWGIAAWPLVIALERFFGFHKRK
jgi:hypothetical protein